MSSFSSSLGSTAPEGMYARGPSSSSVGWNGSAAHRSSPPRGGASSTSDSAAASSDTQTASRDELLLLEPVESAPRSREALDAVLKALHPDAMLSGRLNPPDVEWPSRPDVIRSELYMPQVPEDHPDYYPYRDGDNLAESTLHADGLVELRVNLRTALAHLSRTYVGLDQLLNYDRKNRTLMLAPDIYVLRDTDIKPGDDIKSIRTWEQGVPSFVLELVSDSSLKNDLVHKLRVYAKIGVSEYVVWDPKGEHLTPKMRYYRLQKGVYQEVRPEFTPEGEPKITLDGLPVTLFCDGFHMRVQDRETGELYLGADEERALRLSACMRETEAVQREVEAQRAAEAERERAAQAQQREAEAVQREAEAQRAAEAERERAKQALQREAEAQRAAEAERERAEQALKREAEAQAALEAQATELLALRALLAGLQR